MKQCLFCNSKKLYVKSPTQVRCALCKRTWSEQKYERERLIIEAFLNDDTALLCAKKNALTYQSVQHVYTKIRLLLTTYAQKIYANKEHAFTEYDEFYYLPKSKQKSHHSMLEAIGIFGMLYDNWVYTLFLPEQFSPLKRLLTFEPNIEIGQSFHTRYFNQHKVMHINRFEHTLKQFWIFFEAYLRPYKGVKKENILYYLKSAEFKFNYTKEEQHAILMQLWRENM